MRKIRKRICHRCKNQVEKSNNPEYSYQCLMCDEDLYEIETIDITNYKITASRRKSDVIIGDIVIGFSDEQKAHQFSESVNAHRGCFIGGEFDGLNEKLADALNYLLIMSGEDDDVTAI